jgi:hypothetical protein
VIEGCLLEDGMRKLLRFNGHMRNVGAIDLVLGPPSNHLDLFEFSPCHMHYHFTEFAAYSLVDDEGETVAEGHKQAFCVTDWLSWAWPFLEGASEDGDDGQFHCFNQGLTVGWQDTYEADIDCQWVDVTDVPPGDYFLRIELNVVPENGSEPRLVERNYANNVVEVPVTVP